MGEARAQEALCLLSVWPRVALTPASGQSRKQRAHGKWDWAIKTPWPAPGDVLPLERLHLLRPHHPPHTTVLVHTSHGQATAPTTFA